MFSEEALAKVKALAEQWQRRCLEMYGEREFKPATARSGFELKPVYTPLESKDADFEDIGFPGEYPYTRGQNLQGYQAVPWMPRLGLGFGSGKDTRERWEYLRSLGMRLHIGREEEEELPRMNVLMDLPSWHGYDPDNPKARGRVGECGVSVCSIKDLELMFDGLPLDKVQMTFIFIDPIMAMTALYAVYGERRGYPSQKLTLVSVNTLYHSWYCAEAGFPPEAALKLMVEYINYRAKHMPQGTHTQMPGYNPGEAGATPVQELAFSLASAICLLDECKRAGLDPDEVAPGFYYHPHLSLDFFEEIAKIRAYRRMWAKIMKERFGCLKPQSLKIVMQGQTAGLELTAQEPLNNIIRVTLNTLVGVLAGIDAIWSSSYDEAFAIPTREAAQIALRTQQILYHETNIPNVADPLGGSYYVEWLTNKLEEEAWKLVDKIEELGGYLKCWETGWLRGEVERSSNKWSASVDSGQKIKVGVNKYRVEEPQKIQVFEVDPTVEQDAIERVRRYRAERDNEKTQQALAQLRATAERWLRDWPSSRGILLPALLDAARADATLGEMQGILMEVCGYGYTH